MFTPRSGHRAWKSSKAMLLGLATASVWSLDALVALARGDIRGTLAWFLDVRALPSIGLCIWENEVVLLGISTCLGCHMFICRFIVEQTVDES